MKQIFRTAMKTYQAAVLQSRAHRVIKDQLARALRAHGLTMMQWSIVGLVADAGEAGVRISDLAKELSTSLAFVTTTVNVLEAKQMVKREGHSRDSRSKIIRLEPAFAERVEAIEAEVAAGQTKSLYRGIDPNDTDTYFKVLMRIAAKAAH